jgi:hypothetical protein
MGENPLNYLYRICVPSVVSEVIDGEAIIMDMRTGFYFSADGVAALVWDAIAKGSSLNDIEDWTERHFSEQSLGDVRAFIDQLIEKGLIIPEEYDKSRVLELPEPGIAYAPPLLLVHGDMQDLIMLDPIHDVSEAGWPVAKAETAESDDAS